MLYGARNLPDRPAVSRSCLASPNTVSKSGTVASYPASRRFWRRSKVAWSQVAKRGKEFETCRLRGVSFSRTHSLRWALAESSRSLSNDVTKNVTNPPQLDALYRTLSHPQGRWHWDRSTWKCLRRGQPLGELL